MPADRWCPRCRDLRAWVRVQMGRSARCCAHCGSITSKAKPKPPKRLHADRAWSRAVRERDGYRCRKCGGPGGDGAHVISRRYLKTRHNVANGLDLCRGCHSYFTAHPVEWREFLESEMTGRATELAVMAGAPIR